MVVETGTRTSGLLKELYGPQLDILSTLGTDRRLSDDELNSLFAREFDKTVVYSNPYFKPQEGYRDRIMNTVRNAYTKMSRTLARYVGHVVRPPKQVAVVDAFDVEFSPMLIPTNDGGYLFTFLPAGQVNAFYTDDANEALAVDAIAIPGTEKNRRARDIYSMGIKMVEHMMNINAIPHRAKERLRGIRNFYSDMVGNLSDEYQLFMTSLHEGYHHALRALGISHELSRYDNEGLTENLVEATEGESHAKKGTTYHGFMSRVKHGIRRIGRGISSAFDFVRNYTPGMGEELGRQTGLAGTVA